MAQDGEPDSNKNGWHSAADLLVSELSSSEAASSVQAVRRLFDGWETQLLETLKRKTGGSSVAALVCQRELLTRFYRTRNEFDAEFSVPDALPVKIPPAPDFSNLGEQDGENCVAWLGPLVAQWMSTLSQKFTVLEYHRHELSMLFNRFLDRETIRDAIAEQSGDLSSIAENLGMDSAVKALCNDALRKTLAPLAANKTLDSASFRDMLSQDRRNFDGLTIDGGGAELSIAGCSFRDALFRNMRLQLNNCALHGTRLDASAAMVEITDCEFGRHARGLKIDRLRGDYSNTRFNNSDIGIVFPGTRIGHLFNSRIGEFGGQAKRVDQCRISTLRGLLFQTHDTFVERAIRARFGPVIQNLRCSVVTDCRFGSRVIEGVRSINRYHGTAGAQSTFVNTAFGSIEADSNLFRLRECLVKQLKGHVGTLERSRVAEVLDGAVINKTICSEIEHLAGGHLKVCGTHEERKEDDDNDDTACTRIRDMSAGDLDHLNGRLERFTGGRIGRIGFTKTLRLGTLKKYIGCWEGGKVMGLDKKSFLSREKDTLRTETQRVAKAIRERAARERQGVPASPNSDTRATSAPSKATETGTPSKRARASDNGRPDRSQR